MTLVAPFGFQWALNIKRKSLMNKAYKHTRKCFTVETNCFEKDQEHSMLDYEQMFSGSSHSILHSGVVSNGSNVPPSKPQSTCCCNWPCRRSCPSGTASVWVRSLRCGDWGKNRGRLRPLRGPRWRSWPRPASKHRYTPRHIRGQVIPITDFRW